MVRPAAISRMHVPGMSGGFLDLHNWRRRVWKKALGASSSYDGRHTAASLLIHEDRSLPYVTAFLGHSPAKTTLDHYAHVYAEAQRSGGEDGRRDPRCAPGVRKSYA